MENQNNIIKLMVHGAPTVKTEPDSIEEKREKQWQRMKTGINLFCFSMVLFVILALGSQNISAGLMVMGAVILGWGLYYPIHRSLMNDCVKIDGENIRVVTEGFIRREKQFSFHELVGAQLVSGHSHQVKGVRIRFLRYIVLYGEKKRYLFKIAACEESLAIFGKYLNAVD